MKELFSIICLLGAVQAIFLAIALLLKKENRTANRFLSLFMVFVAFDMLELFLGAKEYFIVYIPYYLCIIPYPYIFGPSIFLYISLLTAKIKRPSKKLLLFYIPFLLMFFLNTIILYFYGTPEPGQTTHFPEIITFTTLFIHGSGLLFETILYIICLIFLHNYGKRLNDFFSNADRFKLSALKYFIFSIILIDLAIIIPFTEEGHIRHNYELLDLIAILGGLGLLFAVAFLAIMQPEIFNKVRLMDEAAPDNDLSIPPKYEKLRLPIEMEESYVKNLTDYMDHEKPYLEDELTLQDLADALSISTHQLSMILNIHFKQNFYNFINSYRVEEIKNKLSDPHNIDINILSIAYSAGFNSKSTFNTMFKKFTGKTPKEYRADFSNNLSKTNH